MTRVANQRWTAKDLLQLPSDKRCELIDGELVMMAPAGDYHGSLASGLGGLIWQHVKQNKLGRTYAAETGFLLKENPDRVRAPDVAFIRQERVRPPQRGYYPGAPDLAVEVVSPDEAEKDVLEKVEQWLEAGTRMIWVVWPETRSMTVHTPDRDPLVLHEGDTLEGGDVLPGFQCDVAEVFE